MDCLFTEIRMSENHEEMMGQIFRAETDNKKVMRKVLIVLSNKGFRYFTKLSYNRPKCLYLICQRLKEGSGGAEI